MCFGSEASAPEATLKEFFNAAELVTKIALEFFPRRIDFLKICFLVSSIFEQAEY